MLRHATDGAEAPLPTKQWSGTGPEIAKRRLREGIQLLAGLGQALLASAEIVTNRS